MAKAVTTKQHDCDIQLHRSSDGSVITVAGNLDWSSAAELLSEVSRTESEPRLVIDLSSVKRLDSAGTGALITTILHEGRARRQLAVVAIDEVAELLGALGIGQVVPVVPTLAAAEASVRSTPGA